MKPYLCSLTIILIALTSTLSAQACLFDDKAVQNDLVKEANSRAERVLDRKIEKIEVLHFEYNYIKTDETYQCPDQFVVIAKLSAAPNCSTLISAVQKDGKIRTSIISESCK